MDRRHFIVGATAASSLAATAVSAASASDIPIIDCHIHLFDGTRPQGAPYKGGRDFQGGIASPAMYGDIATPQGIVGVIAVDASPWMEDNLWLLETIQSAPICVGAIGNLQPDKPEFPEYLDRYAKNPLFRGIRYGNLWKYDLLHQVDNPVFIDGLKRMAGHDLLLETANQTVPLLQAAVKINDKVPELRIVLDHLPALDPTPENQAAYDAVLKELAPRKNIWTKLSEIVHPVRGTAGTPPVIEHGLAPHKARLDTLVGIFGEDRVVFGSDWPNAVGVSEIPDTVALVREYFAGKSHLAAEKYFWKNSVAAYKWVKRTPQQSSLS